MAQFDWKHPNFNTTNRLSATPMQQSMAQVQRYVQAAPKKGIRKKPRTNYGQYQWDSGMTFEEKAAQLAQAGVLSNHVKDNAFVDDLDKYQSAAEQVADYLRNSSSNVQKYYGVYDDLHQTPVTSLRITGDAQTTAQTPRAVKGSSAPSRANYDGMSFSKAFAAARRAGLGTFSWRGKQYTTELANGKKNRNKPAKASSTVPAPGLLDMEPMDAHLRLSEDVNPDLAPYRDLDARITHNPYNPGGNNVPYTFVNPEGAISQMSYGGWLLPL